MKAIRIHGRGGPDHLVYEDAPQPHPGPGEVLVRIHATGVFATGAEVSAMLGYGRDGAEADYTIALPDELAPKPHALDHVQAAAVPLSALTAWLALFEHARLEAGQTALIHGGAGGVGVFAVQLARWAGAQVIATASARNRDFLHELGASVVIDYSAERFEEVVHNIDVVFDLVGGETLARSWQVLKPGGVLVSVVSPQPPADVTKGHDARFAWFIVEPNRELLIQIGALIDAGQLRPIIDAVFPLSQARQAYEQGTKGHMRGKIVLRVAD